MNVLVTGSTGFVGEPLCLRLEHDGVHVRRLVRHGEQKNGVVAGDITGEIDGSVVMRDIDCVIHLAGRAHIMRESTNNPMPLFREVNVEGTRNLVEQAIKHGVKRFVFISTIKVNGETTGEGCDKRFTEKDEPNPQGAYAKSKYEAENMLREMASQSEMDYVIIRTPLVYGPRVKGNFLVMMNWLYKGFPLPFGAIKNRRSLIALDNLVDFIVTCASHPLANNQVFLVSDGDDISTSELLKRTAVALGVRPMLLPMPPLLLKIGAGLLGKASVATRLIGSLQVDISKARNVLGWTPIVDVDEGIKKTADSYRLEHGA